MAFFLRLSRFKFTFEDQYAVSFLCCCCLVASTSHTITLVNGVTFHTGLNTLTISGNRGGVVKLVLGSSRRDVILMKHGDRREALARPDVALGPPCSPLFQRTFDHLLVVHVVSGVRRILIDRHGGVQSGVGIQSVPGMSLHTLGSLVEADARVRAVLRGLERACARVRTDLL